jgi:hypothetical protein
MVSVSVHRRKQTGYSRVFVNVCGFLALALLTVAFDR